MSDDLRKDVPDAHEWTLIFHDRLSSHVTSNTDSNTRMDSNWTKPSPDYFKCNYDCRFRENINAYGAWIFRDSKGFSKETGQSKGFVCSNALEAELQALLMAIQHAWSRGYRKVVFEGDNKIVFNLLTDKDIHFGVHNWIREIKVWSQKFEHVQFIWTSKTNNRAADRLVKELINALYSFISHYFVPNILVQILFEDHSSVLSS